jgi:hypothetical protein
VNRRSCGLLAASVAVAFALHRLGRGPLTAPPAWNLQELQAWATSRGVIGSSMVALRLAALTVSLYLTAVSAIALAAGATRCRPLAYVAHRLTPRLLRPALGLAFVPLFAVPLPAFAADDTPVMVQVSAVPAQGDAPIMRWVGPSEPALTTTTAPVPTSTAAPATTGITTTTAVAAPVPPAPVTTMVPPPPAATEGTWVIRRGDHLWSIAAETLEDRLDRPPAPREVARYWRALVAANRDRLVDPANPDLVFAGHEITLPPSL